MLTKHMDREGIVQLLKERGNFEGVPATALASLVGHGEPAGYPPGAHLTEQGKLGDALWILLSGRVGIEVDGLENSQIDAPGTLLGEISAVSRTPATATVVALTEVSALRISHQDLHRVLSSSRQLASALLRSLAKYL